MRQRATHRLETITEVRPFPRWAWHRMLASKHTERDARISAAWMTKPIKCMARAADTARDPLTLLSDLRADGHLRVVRAVLAEMRARRQTRAPEGLCALGRNGAGRA
jgi:hypothetical protein